MFLLDDILLAPVKTIAWMGEKIGEVVQTQEQDDGRLKDSLLELQMRLELGQISPEDFQRRESALLERLETIRSEENG